MDTLTLEAKVGVPSRHFLLDGAVRSTDAELVSGFTWQGKIRYAVWSIREDLCCHSFEFRAYVEMTRPSVAPAVLLVDDLRTRVAPAMDRDARQGWVVDGAAHVWEHGDWEAGRKGRRMPVGQVPQLPSAATIVDTTTVRNDAADLGSLRQEVSQLVRLMERDREERERLHRTIAEQQEQIRELMARPTHVTNNNSVNITINSFGHEDTSFLDMDTLKKRFLARGPGVVETIRDVHFNDARPENRNVRMLSRKKRLAACFVKGKWQVQPVMKAVDDMIYNGYRINTAVYLQDTGFSEKVHDDPLFMDHCQWMQDMVGVKLAHGTTKKHVARTRGEVRALLLGSPGSAPEDCSPPREPVLAQQEAGGHSSVV